MAFDPSLKQGEVLNNKELCELFGCGPQGGMRKSNRSQSLVIISNHVESIYDDRWDGGVFYYTGMGLKGDQSLDFMQNKTLAGSKSNGISVFLFEVFEDKGYTYQGPVNLADSPFQENQMDEQGVIRKVWIFPLELAIGTPIQVEPLVMDRLLVKKLSKESRKISDSRLKKFVEQKTGIVVKRVTQSTTSKRDPMVILYALRRAGGICQLCEQPAPFKTKQGDPFLEIHHVKYLSGGGFDTYDNVVALCPNCHSKVHIREERPDFDKLVNVAKIPLS